jgi:hypothetical protein
MPLIHRKQTKKTAEKKAKFIAMAAQGMIWADIERELDICHQTAMLWVRKLDLPRHAKGAYRRTWKAPICPDCHKELKRVESTAKLWECECLAATRPVRKARMAAA